MKKSLFRNASGSSLIVGIDSIPVQVFFDSDGKEVFRHVGFYPQEEIEKQMAKLGVK